MKIKEHWDNVYSTKEQNEVSWTQEYPTVSINFLENLKLPKSAKIIDIGGGDSKFVDALIEKGYENITILDISSAAIEKAKSRLKEKADNINWVVSDILDFESEKKYDFWHDRAVFHFLTDEINTNKYIDLLNKYLNKNGYFLLGTFSENGPLKCSGLNIKQYSESEMTLTFDKYFNKIDCFTQDHKTPFNTFQHFQFCSFQKK